MLPNYILFHFMAFKQIKQIIIHLAHIYFFILIVYHIIAVVVVVIEDVNQALGPILCVCVRVRVKVTSVIKSSWQIYIIYVIPKEKVKKKSWKRVCHNLLLRVVFIYLFFYHLSIIFGFILFFYSSQIVDCLFYKHVN